MLIIASLIFFGILLMLIELLLIPGVGVAGFLSLASLVGSCVYAFMYIGAAAGVTTTVVVICLLAATFIYILRAKTWKKFETDTVIDSKVNEEGSKVNLGDKGLATTRLAPMGSARFGDTGCEVKSEDNSMIAAGTAIEVTRIEDNKILVKPIKD